MAENHYDVPSWAGKPPLGLHLDVLKDNKLIQKLMIDEKKCYLFGRNPTLNDFCIDHASCSRVHAAFVYHKHLDRAFLVDLGSTHGTFIGSVRIESNKPTQLPVDSTFHFGASTRYYVLREKPNQVKSGQRDGEVGGEDVDGNPANLPENELELDNLTEYNTAHNKRISMLGIGEEVVKRPRKRPHNAIRFKEEEDVINPEDIDPTVGKFRNLVQTAVIPNKRAKIGSQPSPLSMGIKDCGHFNVLRPHYDKLTATSGSTHHISPLLSSSLSLKLGIHLPNPAPEVDIENPEEEPMSTSQSSCSGEHEEHQESNTSGHLTKKKKYAKEAWPGKKPGSFLM